MTTCDRCKAPYEKLRRSQRFCSTKCRQAYHNSKKSVAGPLGIITGARKLKNGSASVTVIFANDDAMRSLHLEVGGMVVVGRIDDHKNSEPLLADAFSKEQIDLDFGDRFD